MPTNTQKFVRSVIGEKNVREARRRKDWRERHHAEEATSRDSSRSRRTRSEIESGICVEVERICKIWKKGLPARCMQPRENEARPGGRGTLRGGWFREETTEREEEREDRDVEGRNGEPTHRYMADWMQVATWHGQVFLGEEHDGCRLPGSQFG